MKKKKGLSLTPNNTYDGLFSTSLRIWPFTAAVKTSLPTNQVSGTMMVWVPFLLLCFSCQSHPVPMPKPSTSSSCAPDSSISGTTDCTGRGPLGEKAPRGRDTSRGQSSSGGSPIKLWGTEELWSGGSFSSPHLQGQSQLPSRTQQKEKLRTEKIFPLASHLLKDFA